MVGLQGLHWGLFLDIEEDMDILQFKNELNFEFTDDNDLMQKLRKFYTADDYTPEITIDGDIIRIKIDEKAFRTVQRDFEKALDLCNRHEFDKGEKLLKDIITRCPLHVGQGLLESVQAADMAKCEAFTFCQAVGRGQLLKIF